MHLWGVQTERTERGGVAFGAVNYNRMDENWQTKTLV